MSNPCEACEHPERTAVEEALTKGESYQDLKQRFKLSIGTMKRHRRGHMNGEGKSSAADEPGEEVFSERTYLRFGALPKGGTSWSPLDQTTEEGLSVFRARKGSRGNYTLDIDKEGVQETLQQLVSLAGVIGARRRVYEAAGEEVGFGYDGEPLLADASLKPIPLRARVHLPEWLDQEGRKLAEMWNRRGRRGKTGYDRALMNQGVRMLVAAGEALHPEDTSESQATRERIVRSVFSPEVKRFMGWESD